MREGPTVVGRTRSNARTHFPISRMRTGEGDDGIMQLHGSCRAYGMACFEVGGSGETHGYGF